MKQLSLAPAGAQVHCEQTVAVSPSGQRVAYASTLALYIYDAASFELESMISVSERTILGIAWSPHSEDRIVTVAEDGKACVWRVGDEAVDAKLSISLDATGVHWSPHDADAIIVQSPAQLSLWNSSSDGRSSAVRSVPAPQKKADRSSSFTCLRFSPRVAHLAAAGLSSGSVVLLEASVATGIQLQERRLRNGDERESLSSVADLQWDPLGSDYLLAGHADASVNLWDGASGELLSTFPRQGGGLSGVQWLPWAPGNFATCSARAGVLRVWNVSQPHCLEHVRIGGSGVHCLRVLRDGRGFATFADGAFVSYHLRKRHFDFVGEGTHTETAFSCAYSPVDAGLLATASYDASVKLWRMDGRHRAGALLPKENGTVVYCVIWSPDGAQLVTGDFNGTVRLWDVAASRCLAATLVHNRAVYALAWQPSPGSTRVASVGHDGFLRVVDVGDGGRVLQQYRIGGPCYGCDWCPHAPDMLAATCMDGKVRVFDTTKAKRSAPVLVLDGHVQRAFSVRWSPLLSGTLATTGDDRTVRVWRDVPLRGAPWPNGDASRWGDLSGVEIQADGGVLAKHAAVLKGHGDFSRPCLWHPELPWLLLSGGWDARVICWDIRSGRVLCQVAEHLADIYGLAVDRRSPFKVATTSRDTTLRFWQLTCADALRHKAFRAAAAFAGPYLCAGALPAAMGLTGTVAAAMAGDACLCGDESAALEAEVLTVLRSAASGSRAERTGALASALYAVAGFFGTPAPAMELWDALHCISRGDARRGRRAEENRRRFRVVHATELMAVQRGRAAEAAGAAGPAGSAWRQGGLRRDDRLRLSAMLRVQGGDVVGYCEALFSIGDYEKALSVAPGAGLDYWRELSGRYAQILEDRLSEQCVPHLVASGDADRAASFYLRRGDFQEATVVGHAPLPAHGPAVAAAAAASTGATGTTARRALGDVGERLFRDAVREGCPGRAAAALLQDYPSGDGAEDAALVRRVCSYLAEAGEDHLALGVLLVLDGARDTEAIERLLERGCELLAWRSSVAEGVGAAAACAFSGERGETAALLSARHAPDGAAQDAAHDAALAAAALPSREALVERAEKCSRSGRDALEALRYFVLARRPRDAASAAVDLLGAALPRTATHSFVGRGAPRKASLAFAFAARGADLGWEGFRGLWRARCGEEKEDGDGAEEKDKDDACAEVMAALRYLRCIRAEDLPGGLRRAILALAYYLGAWAAMARGYARIVPALYDSFAACVGTPKAKAPRSEAKAERGQPAAGASFPLSMARVGAEVASYLAAVGKMDAAADVLRSCDAAPHGGAAPATREELAALSQVRNDMEERFKELADGAGASVGVRNIVVCGDAAIGGVAALRRLSYVDGTLLKTARAIEMPVGERLALSMSDAQMWHNCCAHSPVASGDMLAFK